MKTAFLFLILVALAVAACTAPTATVPPIGQFGGRAVLGISNGTPLAVTLYVNGQAVGTAMPRVGL